METVVSGIRSTGQLHLGNYFGAVANFVKMQNEHRCFFFIADYHSLTTHTDPAAMQKNVRQVLVEYLACGIDPEKATLFVQSDLPQVAELYLLLNMHAGVGELERCTSFKEKIKKHPDNVNAGLLTYPTLMAADILIHKATKVPVGKDQEQHLEMARNFGNRFNHRYESDVFPEPYAYNFNSALVKIPGLDGSGKMGKSEGAANAIYLAEDAESIRKKVMRAVTDAGPSSENQQKPEAVENLFTLLKVVSATDVVQHFDNAYNDCSIRYGDLKKQLAEDIISFTAPIKDKIESLSADTAYLSKVAKLGAEKAAESANATIRQVRELVGFKKI